MSAAAGVEFGCVVAAAGAPDASRSGDSATADAARAVDGGVLRSIGGTVSGLLGSGLGLEDNAGKLLDVKANGTFTFPTKLAVGAHYAVTVHAAPKSPS